MDTRRIFILPLFDALVYELYVLREEEIALVEKHLDHE
jgi:hypothetical protein